MMTVKLGSIASIVMGQAPAGADCNKEGNGTVFVKAGEFGTPFPLIREWTTNPLRMAQNRDTLVCVVGATCGKVNKGIDCAIGRSVAAVRPSSEVHPDYLFGFLSSQTEKIRENAQGAAQGVVTREMIADLPIPLPPLAEQKRIAAILDAADALRAQRRRALTRLDDLARSLFLHHFGDPVSNPKGWPTRTLKSLGKVTTGGTPSGKKEGMYGGPTPFITPGDLESSEPPKRTLSPEGALEVDVVRTGATLVCCIGATIGKMMSATEPSAFNQQINAVEWGADVDDSYGLSVLRFHKKCIAELGTSTTMPILKKSSFEQLTIPLPPLALQQRFARKLALVEAQKFRQRAHLAKLDALFASLQSRAFTGGL